MHQTFPKMLDTFIATNSTVTVESTHTVFWNILANLLAQREDLHMNGVLANRSTVHAGFS